MTATATKDQPQSDQKDSDLPLPLVFSEEMQSEDEQVPEIYGDRATPFRTLPDTMDSVTDAN